MSVEVNCWVKGEFGKSSVLPMRSSRQYRNRFNRSGEYSRDRIVDVHHS